MQIIWVSSHSPRRRIEYNRGTTTPACHFGCSDTLAHEICGPGPWPDEPHLFNNGRQRPSSWHVVSDPCQHNTTRAINPQSHTCDTRGRPRSTPPHRPPSPFRRPWAVHARIDLPILRFRYRPPLFDMNAGKEQAGKDTA